MQTLSQIRALLAERGLRPQHRLGQHFLHDKNQLAKLVDAAELAAGDLVLEIGPGTGTLTEALLDHGVEVVACELDFGLVDLLEDRLGQRLTLVRGDCLHRGRALTPELVDRLAGRPFKLVANLPYQVASPLMVTLLIQHAECRGQYVTIQREVADRLLAGPGGKTFGPLGVIVQALATVRRIALVKPSSFWPAPQVSSAMVAVVPRGEHGIEDPAALASFVSRLFARRRKQLGAVFGREARWPDGVTGDQRPETLSVDQIVELWRELGKRRSDEATERRREILRPTND